MSYDSFDPALDFEPLDLNKLDMEMLMEPYNTTQLVLGRMLMEQALRELRATVYQQEQPLAPVQWANWWIKSRPYISRIQWSICAQAMIQYLTKFHWAGCSAAIARLEEAESSQERTQVRGQ